MRVKAIVGLTKSLAVEYAQSGIQRECHLPRLCKNRWRALPVSLILTIRIGINGNGKSHSATPSSADPLEVGTGGISGFR